MQADPAILTLTGGLLVIFVMMMGLMLGILRRLDKVSEKVEANTVAITSLAARLETRTTEIDAKIETRTAEILAGIAINRQRIDANETAIESNRTAIETNRTAIETNRKAIETNRKAIETNRKAIETNRKAIETNRKAIETNRTRIDACIAYLREFRIETRENFELIRARIEKLDDRHP